jgi:hypothetical protein
MHVVIGQEGMQQGLAFNPSVLLFKSFLIFDASELHERSVSTLHAKTYKHTIHIKNAKNGAKTKKLRLKQD